jgi:hypothetical protein
MGGKLVLQFDDEPVLARYIKKVDDWLDDLEVFKKKYSEMVPEIEDRFSFDADEGTLLFSIGNQEQDEYESGDDDAKFLLSFFESNLEYSRPVNGFGGNIPESFYSDLFSLMQTDGEMYWSNGGSSFCVNFLGSYDFEAYCWVKNNGCFWEVD